MFGWNNLSVVVVLTIGVCAVIAQAPSAVTMLPLPTTTTLKPSQGLGPDHCKKCGNETDDASRKLKITGAAISSCNLIGGISSKGIDSSLFQCVCKSQFNGTYNGVQSDGIRCYDVDECSSNTDWCDNHATCSNTVGGFTCTCNDGFKTDDGGKTCADIEECANKIAHVCGYETKYGDFGSCREEFGSYSCDCKPGFRRFNITANGKNHTCENIDECKDAGTCKGDHKRCNNTVGSFECYCDAGYEYINSTCQNIDECAVNGTNNCGNFTKCVDKEGSFECQCEGDGFRFVSNTNNTVCEDYNECTTESDYTCNDPHKSQCINYDGGYSCGCDKGYSENNVTVICEDIDECRDERLNDCVENAACTNNNGSYSCACIVGFTRDAANNCSDINECQSRYNNTCDPKAKCSNTIGNYTCQCISGYTGDGTSCTELVTLDDLLANHTETGRDRYRSLIEHEELVKTQLLVEKRILQRRCDEKNLKKNVRQRSKRQVILPSRFISTDGDQRFELENLKQANSMLRLDNQGIMRDCNVTANGGSYFPFGK